jgi:HK97 family phage portal protein
MLQELVKEFLYGKIEETKQITPQFDQNLLNRIVYGQIMNNLIIWYDGNQETFIKDGYQSNAMVYSIIEKISTKITVPDLQVFSDKKTGSKYKSFKYSSNEIARVQSRVYKKKELALVEKEDDFTKLLKTPNPKQTEREFREEVNKWFNITGETFIYGFSPDNGLNKGKPIELYCLPSHLVVIEQGGVMQPVKGYKLIIGDQTVLIPADQVLHIKRFNPEWDLVGSQLRGQSPLLAGLKLLRKNNAGIESGAKSNENQGAKGIVSPNINNPELFLTKEQREALDQNVEKRINGNDNMGKVVTSGLPLQYTQIGLSPVAMDLIKSLEYDDDKLCGLWGVNPVIFKPNATDANLEHAQKSLVTDVCLPFLSMYELKMAEWLNPKFKTDYVIDFDVTSYAELQPDMELIKNVFANNPAYTWNELRTMQGFDESEEEGANLHWVGTNLVPARDAVLGMDMTDFTGNQ